MHRLVLVPSGRLGILSRVMEPFLQDPPRFTNRFRTDRALRATLERLLPEDVYLELAPELDAMGALAAGELADLVEQAERNPPRHVPWDAWGRRIDRVDVDPAWLRIIEIGREAGVVAAAYEDRFGAWARVAQFALLDLYDPSSATADCPLSMSDAAARVLIAESPELAERWVPGLTARRDAVTAGQWMTEIEGGSDVSRSSTVARRRVDGTWTLHGAKWFTSAIVPADVALLLARPEGAEQGSRGLSLFFMELRDASGSWNGITIRRLKDKLGTKSLPTAEVDLDGAVAVQVGDLGHGVRKIATMLNITRVHAAFGSVGAMGAALDLARDYAGRREAFGRPIGELPLHRAWIARVAAEVEAAQGLAYRAAELLGAAERTGEGAELVRVVMPLAKMAISRQAVWVTSELMESFGGAGYVEDTGIPRMLRDAHVNCIWEGTTSVLALDVLRALAKSPQAAAAFCEDVEARARAYDHPLIAGPARAVRDATVSLRQMMLEAHEGAARRIAWGMARTYEAALLCEAAGWALDKKGDARAATAAALFTSEPLVGPGVPVDDAELGALAFGRDEAF
ncbi:MAG: acyl-CoA dehydrogenase family protein [Actinomycetota bacterium]